MQKNELTLEECINELQNKVYSSSLYFELLEQLDKVHGNGHHMAQYIAKIASYILINHWLDKEEVQRYIDEHNINKDNLENVRHIFKYLIY